MTSSTTSLKARIKKIAWGLAAALFWLAVWQLAYLAVAREILLVSPVQAVTRLFSLASGVVFWRTVAASCLRVVAGFLGALSLGSVLAVVCTRFEILRRLTAPLMGVVRATPVASFIILALVWLATDRIPVFISFLVVLPIVWGNLMAGLGSVDRGLLEMAAIFRLPRGRVLRYIYLPAEAPHFAAAASAGLGLAWKSAVAAEVIARPSASIGKQLNDAKIYLETADVFAWTVAVVLLSLLVEKAALWLLGRLTGRLSGPSGARGGKTNVAAD